jgi:ribonuclease HI
MKNIKIFTDGGSRGNPGQSAIGILILDEEKSELFRLGKQIGLATNNIAEYTAVFEALLWVKNNLSGHDLNLQFYLDSSLVVNQLNGVFKIKNQELKKIILKIKNLEKDLAVKINYFHVPREKNKIADFLVNSAF